MAMSLAECLRMRLDKVLNKLHTYNVYVLMYAMLRLALAYLLWFAQYTNVCISMKRDAKYDLSVFNNNI